MKGTRVITFRRVLARLADGDSTEDILKDRNPLDACDGLVGDWAKTPSTGWRLERAVVLAA
jgi:hypothetical protein